MVGWLRRARVVDRFSPTAEGVRWQVEITVDGEPWTTPIEFHLRYPVTPGVRFWTAWADPDPAPNPMARSADASKPAMKNGAAAWHDPLVTMPPRKRRLYYGAPPFEDAGAHAGFIPSETDLFSIPVATFSEPSHNAGLSVALALNETLLDLTLD
ncbi:MAG: hypothetical protein ACRD27_00665, partial [Terracidiphilus sp.]